MWWAGHVARAGECRGVYKVLVGILREGDQLEDAAVYGTIILKMDLQEMGCFCMDWIHVPQAT